MPTRLPPGTPNSPGATPCQRILTGDCVRRLAEVPEGTVDLAFADPPFNIGYEYDLYQDKKNKDDYLAWTETWLSAVRRTLAPTASLFVAIGDEYAAEMKLMLDRLGMTMRNWIVWHYTFGVSCTKKFNRSHAHIFYYTADPKEFTFNADAVRVPSARQTMYNDRRANPKGKLPDDTWVLRPEATRVVGPVRVTKTPDGPREPFAADSDTWAVNRICGTFTERTPHPCQMPEAVLERIIRVASNPGDLVLDPFAGSGTTPAVAKRLRRRFLGIELSEQYVELINERLARVVVEPEPVPTVSAPRTPGVAGRSRAAGMEPRPR